MPNLWAEPTAISQPRIPGGVSTVRASRSVAHATKVYMYRKTNINIMIIYTTHIKVNDFIESRTTDDKNTIKICEIFRCIYRH